MSEANFPNEITSPRLTTLFGWTGNLVDTPIAGQVRMYYNYGTNLVEAVDPNGSAITFASAGGGGVLQSATVTLSAAQLKALSITPIQLVATPGAGKMVRPVSITLQYKAGAVPFTLDPDNPNNEYVAMYGAGQTLASSGANIWSHKEQGIFDQVVSQIVGSDKDIDMEDVQSVFENKALLFSVYNNTLGPIVDMTDGDGTLTVTVYYSVVTLA